MRVNWFGGRSGVSDTTRALAGCLALLSVFGARVLTQSAEPRAQGQVGLGILTGRPTVRPARTEVPPRIDGRLDDEVWKAAATIRDFVQQQPLDGAPATENTTVHIAYDTQNLYFGFHLHYKDPSIMRASKVDRDRAGQSDDMITIFLDTFLDQQRAYVFDVNAYGVQGDGIVNARGGGGGGGRGGRGGGGGGGGGFGGGAIPFPDRSWDTLFHTAARIVEDGYTAEMAIPFKSLRYPQRDGNAPHRWGFQIVREIRSKNEENDVWAPMSRGVAGFLEQMGVLEGMTALSTSRNLEILPTFTAINFGELNEATGGFDSDGTTPEAGLNVKYGLTSNLTADFTLNPDFSQIESDQPQIDVNQRFPLFFPELRPFFLEGQEIFNIFAPINLVHTRTIVDPRYGAKLTGKVGRTAVAVIVADDKAPGKREDRSDPAFGQTAQFLVARVRYDLFAESYIGTLITDREFMDSYSRVGGLDGQFRLGRVDRLNFIAFQSQNRSEDGVERSGPAWGTFYQHNGRNLRLGAFAGSTDPEFKTDAGFIRRVDQQRTFSNLSYVWWPQGPLINWGPSVNYERSYNFDGELEDEVAGGGLNFQFARNIGAGGNVSRALERFGGIDFWQWNRFVRFNMNTSRRVSVSARYGWGDQVFYSSTSPYLGRNTSAGLNLSLRPVPQFESRLSVDTSRFTDPNRGDLEIFDVKIFRGFTTYQFTDRLLVRNISEYNTFNKTLGMNFLVTYRINAGTVFFVGYDDHYQQADRIAETFFPMTDLRRTNRAIFTKLQYLFRY